MTPESEARYAAFKAELDADIARMREEAEAQLRRARRKARERTWHFRLWRKIRGKDASP